MPFAAAVSFHPVTAHATGEVVGQVIDVLGAYPDVAVVAVSASHAGALADAAATVRSLLEPTVLVGWVSSQVATDIGLLRPQGPTGSPVATAAVGLWTAVTGPVRPVRMRDLSPSSVRQALAGPFDSRGAVVLGAAGAERTGQRCLPFGVPIAGAISDVAGGMIVLDGTSYDDGLVGIAIGPGADLTVTIEDGRRPVGATAIATMTNGALLVELDHRPAMSVLVDIAHDQIPATDVDLIDRSLHLAVTSSAGEGPSLHLVRGRYARTGAIVTDPGVHEGDTVQFCVHDPGRAAEQAQRMVAGADGGALAWRTGRGGPARDVRDLLPPSGPVRPVLVCGAATLVGGGSSASQHGGGAIAVGLFHEPQVVPGC